MTENTGAFPADPADAAPAAGAPAVPPLTAEGVLEALDPEQREAARTFGGPLCVLAGAGTGKTRTITHRIAYGVMTGQLNPRHVLAVTFTAKAAAEMRSRLRDLGVPAVQARTFHAAALRQLRHFWPRVIGGGAPEIMPNKIAGVAEACQRLHMSVDRAALRDIVSEVEWSRVSMLTPESYPEAAAQARRPGVAGFDSRSIARILTQYEEVKKERGVIDFEDVLLHMVGFLTERPDIAREIRGQYRHFVVDEYQDVSALQHALLRLWLGPSTDLCVVGDAAQTIYTFAGARASYLLDFPREFRGASTIRLERNYRSTPQIVRLANTVLDGAQGRTKAHRLTLVSQRPAGPAPVIESYADDMAEAEGVAERIQEQIREGRTAADMAVLFRTNSQSEAVEQALTARGIGYLVRGGDRFFERQEVRRALLALRAASRVEHGDAARAVRDVVSALGWSEKAPETTGAVRERWDSLNALVHLTGTILARPGAGLVDVVRELEERAESQSAPVVDGVTLASIHAAKGLEWPSVFVIGASDGLLPISMAQTPAEVEEERRLFYVALTRARDLLTISWSAARTPGSRGSRKPSRFLDGVLEQRGSGARTGPAASSPRRTGRRSATVFSECRTCGAQLTTDAEQRLGRHSGCAPSHGESVLDALRLWRRQRSSQLGVPAYSVFTDATLGALAERAPSTAEEMAQIPGIGPLKVQRHGEEVLAILAGFAAAAPAESASPQVKK
ncbi:ATP-dependent DNA helicase UvrD2 [Brachybacterium sp. JHP9]|uniref:DNA 3'-5' helicase n=1 Tax=Brachybacterium equifaecis TaxID=2910770 RepID=A0ABT0QWK3_9MICO|nr:ATP-dependent DNA helicase UvrD2 [Brachybacterium equifaecis]MCL6421985.1 ATP-dependent DNA helicase UvrD2 [Brachybacterium equifaecis]